MFLSVTSATQSTPSCLPIISRFITYTTTPKPKPKPKLPKQVVQTVTKKPLPEGKKFLILEVICMDAESGDDVEVPYVRLRIK